MNGFITSTHRHIAVLLQGKNQLQGQAVASSLYCQQVVLQASGVTVQALPPCTGVHTLLTKPPLGLTCSTDT